MTKNQIDNVIKSFNDSYQRLNEQYSYNNRISNDYRTKMHFMELQGVQIENGKIKRTNNNINIIMENPDMISWLKNRETVKDYNKQFKQAEKETFNTITPELKEDIQNTFGSLENFFQYSDDFLKNKNDELYDYMKQNYTDEEIHERYKDYNKLYTDILNLAKRKKDFKKFKPKKQSTTTNKAKRQKRLEKFAKRDAKKRKNK